MGDHFSKSNLDQLVEQLNEDEKLELIVRLSKSIKKGRGPKRKTPGKTKPDADSTLATLGRPIRKSLTLEDLVREQNYQGGDQQRFDQLAAELKITESIEELLAQAIGFSTPNPITPEKSEMLRVKIVQP